jgi:NADH-quinone oxidoreductase subunit A
VYFNFANVLIFSLFGIAFVVLNVAILNRICRPRCDSPAKQSTYECGEVPVGRSWVRFDIRFYVVALVFLVFDVEVAFLYPWAVIFDGLKGEFGVFLFLEMLFFVVILMVGYAYLWANGDLDWVKTTRQRQPREDQGGGEE